MGLIRRGARKCEPVPRATNAVPRVVAVLATLGAAAGCMVLAAVPAQAAATDVAIQDIQPRSGVQSTVMTATTFCPSGYRWQALGYKSGPTTNTIILSTSPANPDATTGIANGTWTASAYFATAGDYTLQARCLSAQTGGVYTPYSEPWTITVDGSGGWTATPPVVPSATSTATATATATATVTATTTATPSVAPVEFTDAARGDLALLAIPGIAALGALVWVGWRR